MNIYLVDGTYELFRAYFGELRNRRVTQRKFTPIMAVYGLIRSLLYLLSNSQVSHVAVAFDNVIESFRNDLYDGYKSSVGLPEDLLAQFPLAEQAVEALGIVVWSMIEFEADDALATAATRFRENSEVEKIIICSADKDFTQLVSGKDVVVWDRLRDNFCDEDSVRNRFGVSPKSIPDYLALVGDRSDGIPGIPRWGAKSAATVLSWYKNIDEIPTNADEWTVSVRGKHVLSSNLKNGLEDARLFRLLATLRQDVPLAENISDIAWKGVPRDVFCNFCSEIAFTDLKKLPHLWQE